MITEKTSLKPFIIAAFVSGFVMWTVAGSWFVSRTKPPLVLDVIGGAYFMTWWIPTGIGIVLAVIATYRWTRE